jgi:acyl carrier protein
MHEDSTGVLGSATSEEEQLAGWLVGVLADAVQADPASVQQDVPLWEYGADSLVVATLLAEIDDQRDVWVDPADVPPGSTLRELAAIVVSSTEIEEESDVT